MRCIILSFVLFFTFQLCSAQDPTPDNTVYADSLIELEVKYYAPNSGSVNLAWWVNDYTLEESILWNSDTKTTDQLLYLPMTAHGDTFSILFKAPYNSVLEYYFWTTENKEGHIFDFWDLKACGETIIMVSSPIIRSAVYLVEKQKDEPLLYSKGCIFIGEFSNGEQKKDTTGMKDLAPTILSQLDNEIFDLRLDRVFQFQKAYQHQS